jgi:FeS assembly SUF system protein
MEHAFEEIALGDSGTKVVVPHHYRRPAPDDDEPIREPENLEEWAVEALRTVYDPEIPVNIYDIGLIYHIEADEDGGRVKVWMTLTSPMCPVAEQMPGMVERAIIRSVPGIERTDVAMVWEPPWEPNMMTEGARLELGMI